MPKALHTHNAYLNPWTKEELNILKNISETGNISRAKLTELLPNRTYSAVKAKRKKLHLKPFLTDWSWNKGLTKYTSEIIARMPKKKSRYPDYYTRDKLVEEVGKCELCGFADKRILMMHHRDGNRLHNRKGNLIVLCPNCHTLEHFLKTGRLVLKSMRSSDYFKKNDAYFGRSLKKCPDCGEYMFHNPNLKQHLYCAKCGHKENEW